MKENFRLIAVDDEPGILDAYRSMLSSAALSAGIVSSRQSYPASTPGGDKLHIPFEVTYVSTGEEAVKIATEKFRIGEPFVGGFFDVKLGSGIDGLETIRRIKEMDPNFMCVVVTAYQDRTVEEIRKLLGEEYSANWDIMTKPFFRLEILQKAFNLCSNWNSRQRIKDRILNLNNRMEKHSELMRDVIAIIGSKIIAKAEHGLARNDAEEIKHVLKSILTDASQIRTAVARLEEVSKIEEKKKAA